MQTVQIFLAVVVTLVCVGIGLYISRVNRGYERKKLERAASASGEQSSLGSLNQST